MKQRVQHRSVTIPFAEYTVAGLPAGRYDVRIDDEGVFLRQARTRGPWRFIGWDDVAFNAYTHRVLTKTEEPDPFKYTQRAIEALTEPDPPCADPLQELQDAMVDAGLTDGGDTLRAT
jgi:hypothetical protein